VVATEARCEGSGQQPEQLIHPNQIALQLESDVDYATTATNFLNDRKKPLRSDRVDMLGDWAEPD